MVALTNEYTEYIILYNVDIWMMPGTVLGVGNIMSKKSSSLSLRCLDWHMHIEPWDSATMGDTGHHGNPEVGWGQGRFLRGRYHLR